MLDQPSFWIGFATACALWVALGLGLGAFSISISSEGVKAKRLDD